MDIQQHISDVGKLICCPDCMTSAVCAKEGECILYNDIESGAINVVFTEVPKSELKRLIREVYLSDPDMRDKYHLVKGDIEKQVEYTYNQCVEGEDEFTTKYCAITITNSNNSYHRNVGYTTLVYDEVGLLHTFGIHKDYRFKSVKSKWLEAVSNAFDGGFFVLTLREINSRAINFFKRNGFECEYQPNEKYYLLWPQQ